MHKLEVTNFETKHISQVLKLLLNSIIRSPVEISVYVGILWSSLHLIVSTDLPELAKALGIMVIMMIYLTHTHIFTNMLLFKYTTKNSFLHVLSVFNYNNRIVKIILIILSVTVAVVSIGYGMSQLFPSPDNSNTQNSGFNFFDFIFLIFLSTYYVLHVTFDSTYYPMPHLDKTALEHYQIEGITRNVKVIFTVTLVVFTFLVLGHILSHVFFIIAISTMSIIHPVICYIIYFNNSFPPKKVVRTEEESGNILPEAT